MELFSLKKENNFNKLKNFIFEYFLEYLECREILKLRNKGIYRILFRDNCKILKKLLFRDIIKNKTKNFSINEQSIREIYQSIIYETPYFIPIVAYETTGGFQSHAEIFHYSNIFKLNTNLSCTNYGNFNNVLIKGVSYPNFYINKSFLDTKYPCAKLNLWNLKKGLKKNFNFNFGDSGLRKMKVMRGAGTYLVKKYEPIDENYCKYYYNNQLDYHLQPIDGNNLFDDSHLLNQVCDDNFNSYMFYLSNIFIDLNWGYTCPIKTFALFTYDDPEFNEYDKKIIASFDNTENLEKVGLKTLNVFKNSQISKRVRALDGIEFVNYFDKIEYDPFYQHDKNVKAVCWVNLYKSKFCEINLCPFMHRGRFIGIKFISTSCNCPDTMDLTSFFVFGHMIKLEDACQ